MRTKVLGMTSFLMFLGTLGAFELYQIGFSQFVMQVGISMLLMISDLLGVVK